MDICKLTQFHASKAKKTPQTVVRIIKNGKLLWFTFCAKIRGTEFCLTDDYQ